MIREDSYRIETVAKDVNKEINRLKGQVNLFWDNEVKKYIEYGLCNGLSVVELGSGPGFCTEKIMQTFSDVHVTGVEIDPILVDYSSKYLAEMGYTRFNINQGSIMETGLPDDTFDFAVTRLVLEHLPDPVGAVKEVLRILKPGGKAVFIDNDFEMHIMTYPHIEGLRELYDAYCASRIAEGGNPKIGRELPDVLIKGGFSNIAFDVLNAHSSIIGEEKFLASEGIGIPLKLVKDGFLSSKTLGQVSKGWKKVLNNKEHSIIRQLYIAAGEKV